MPKKQSSIKWRESDEAELTRKVRNFNAKINRLIAKNPDLKDVLPEKLSKKEIKANIETRADFNRAIKSAERFAKKGAEKVITNDYGLAITEYERKEIGIKLGIINRRRTNDRKEFGDIEVVNQGQKTGFKRIDMQSVRMGELKPKKFNFKSMRKDHYKKFIESLNKQAGANYVSKKQEQWVNNYIKSIRTNFGAKGNALIEKIRSLPIDDVVRVLFENENATIEFNYSTFETDLKLKIVSDIWQNM